MNKFIDIYEYLHASKEALRDLITVKSGYATHWVINARVSGQTAAISFDEKKYEATFFLPEVKNGRLTRAQADAFTGYWLHESLHLLYTIGMDDDAVNALRSEYGNYGFSMLNCVEDARIEQTGARDGVAANLLQCLTKLRTHTFLKSGAIKEQATVEQHLPYAIKLAMGEAYGLHTIAADWLSKLPPVFQKCMAHGVEAITSNRLNGPDDSIALARELLQMLKDDEQSDDEQSDDDQSDDEQSDDEQSDDEQSDDEQSDDEQSDDEQSDDEQSDDGQSDDEQSDGEQSDDEQSDDGESGDSEQSGDGSESGGAPVPLDDTLAGVIAGTDASDTLTADMKREIEEAYDFIDTLDKVANSVREFTPMDQLVDSQQEIVAKRLKGTQRLENGLRQALVADENTGTDAYRKRGRVDNRALSRLKAGSTNVFKQRWDTPAHSTAVALVIDRSVSMRGDCWDMAMTLERAATRTFQKARIPFSVMTYNSAVQIKKTAEQTLTDAQLEYNCYATAPSGMTNTTQAIVAAAETLANVTATRKMILVVTDGGCNLGAHAVSEAIRYVKNCKGIDQVNALNVECEPDHAEYDHAIAVTAESLPREGLAILSKYA